MKPRAEMDEGPQAFEAIPKRGEKGGRR